MDWAEGQTSCAEEKLYLCLLVLEPSTKLDVTEQQNYLEKLGFKGKRFELKEFSVG